MLREGTNDTSLLENNSFINLTNTTSIHNDSNISGVSSLTQSNLNLGIMNARSVSAKIESLIETFREAELTLACVSETWLKNRKSTKEAIADVESSQKISAIVRNRQGKRGGGVAIFYDTNKMTLTEIRTATKFEYVCAKGRAACSRRDFFVVSFYIPPNYKAAQTEEMLKEIADHIGKARRDMDRPYVVLAGDANKRNLLPAHEDFCDIKLLPVCPSRGAESLQICASNLKDEIVEICTLPPLRSSEGQDSDHRVVCISCNIPSVAHLKKRKIKVRNITTKTTEKLKIDLLMTDWSSIEREDVNASVESFDNKIRDAMDRCIPFKTFTIKSTDKPWASKEFKRKVRQRKRHFKRRGRDQGWNKLKEEGISLKKRDQRARIERTKKDTTTKNFFKAAAEFSHVETAPRWEIGAMFPGESDEKIAEITSNFFNRISKEYEPVGKPEKKQQRFFLSVHDVSAGLRNIKKPKGVLPGDVPPKALTSEICDILAIPLTYIYNLILREFDWPQQWKKEQVILIPKKPRPKQCSELRNLSCTPLFSKLLEKFLLVELRKYAEMSSSQYGGIKKCGVDHFLIDSWNDILTHLDSPHAAATLVSIDFEKAFNRMHHGKCLEALRKKNVPEHLVGMVQAFLHERTMTVKINDAFSVPQHSPGGAPQGSIFGSYLFCITTEPLITVGSERPARLLPEPCPPLEENGREVEMAVEEEAQHSYMQMQQEHGDAESSEDELQPRFFRIQRRQEFDTSAETTFNATQGNIDAFFGIPQNWRPEKPTVRCYIDDFNIIEKVSVQNSISHYSQNKTKRLCHSKQAQNTFINVAEKSHELQMKVNALKTQLLCISPLGEEVDSYISIDGHKIISGDTLKILGFTFGRRPDATEHVEVLKRKLRAKLWGLDNLLRSGMGTNDLLHIYKAAIRPIADFAAPTYHRLLSEKQSQDIESIQRRAMKTIFGYNVSYRQVVESGHIETLKDRREALFQKFALKNENNPRFKDRWFPRRIQEAHDTRRPEKYLIEKTRTERLRTSALPSMRRFLNSK